MKKAITCLILATLAACGFLNDHPPQICVTASELPDGGGTLLAADAGPAQNPGF